MSFAPHRRPEATSTPASLSPLEITKVETIPMRAPLEREFKGSYYRMVNRATLITRVHTSEGIVGEAWVGDEDDTLLDIDRVVREEITPRVLGRDAFAVEQIWDQAWPATFDILRDRRLGLVATAAIDTAVWDAVGKALGQPLWRLWGGFRSRIPMIVIGGYYGQDDAGIIEEMQGYRDEGLAGCKFKIGGASPAEDARRVAVAREAVGDDFVLAVDANQGYTVLEAVEFAGRAADLDLAWFEEPCRWANDRRAMRDVRSRSTIPVSAGQTELTPSGCRDLMEFGAIDICNFDASWSGGPTAWRRVAGIAHAYDVLMGHHEEPQVASHLIASQSHGTFVECFAPARDPFWYRLVANRPLPRDGFIDLPTTPGLGWDIDWDYVDAHRLDRD